MGKNWVLNDFVSSTASQHLKSSLYSYFNVQRPLQEFVPNGYHFIYFNPKSEESELSFDGYDSHQQPNQPFKRRVWIGGEIQFHNDLKFNKQAFCVESIDSVKNLRTNSLVSINREIITSDGDLSIFEKRNLLYLDKLYKHDVLMDKTQDLIPEYTHELTPTDILMFRFSALTFNSHKIHYDKLYAAKEGYPDILMQGPLSVVLLLEWVTSLNNLKIKSFEYKNVKPIFGNSPLKLCLKESNQKEIRVWIEGPKREIYMTGEIKF
ncbi:hypothetical protein WICMUC_005064 [Wickerhamomyces mucosus]|uniref:MaoC-like domain-containing protein n=1 Tax=Wickerhamomyces mucosus TaxID=1378264 RepID=A0A9P8PCJ3_9ASCO|nr:hypothetical protein WICMUC_005064 [Wickerhamomyces mucosus]